MTAPAHSSLVLGLHPTARGFGWIALEGPFAVFDHGVFTTKGRTKNARCLAEVSRILDRLTPELVLLESFDPSSSLRSGRIRNLCMDIVSMAADRGHEVEVRSRTEVRKAFASVSAKTRSEVAEAVAKQLPSLAVLLPPQRVSGDGEDKRLAIFSAAAVVLTHYHNGATALLDEKRNAA